MFLAVILPAGAVAGWFALNYYTPGSVGTPAHAGVVSHGKPEQCTNVNLSVRARGYATHTALLEDNVLVRATFEAEGGFGGVDIMLRITDPQNNQILVSPRSGSYDFTFPVKLRGEYQFVFDNRYSLYTSKSVGLFYCAER